VFGTLTPRLANLDKNHRTFGDTVCSREADWRDCSVSWGITFVSWHVRIARPFRKKVMLGSKHLNLSEKLIVGILIYRSDPLRKRNLASFGR